ncbi:MAG TPA: double-strand break repair helicase AddA [Micropepsaceae bacterium]|nr:double-strand break repair helicase AddA [Micropepsaceae bacterium]
MSAASQRATDPNVSAWVSANAGAGKTYLLTDRVTRLLLSGASPARILCLTYTKAAAAEMATRLFDRLGEWALLPDAALRGRLKDIGAEPPDAKELRKARTLFAQALETPGGLKIQTIHSFCQHLLARFPVEAGIPARFTVLDERSAAELMGQARTAVLERAGKGDARLKKAVALLATRAADGRFAEILDFAIGDSGRLREMLSRHDGDELRFAAHLQRTLDLAEGEDEAQVLGRFCAELRGERNICERIVPWLLGGSDNDEKSGDRFAAFLDGGMAAEDFAVLREVFFTDQDQPRKSIITKATARAQPELAAYLQRLKERVIAVEERRRCAVTAGLTTAVITVALAVLETYDRLKRSRAALDYDDLTLATLNLLERRDAASWVLYKLDGGLDHILVDEAQDTSPEQWKIVGRLAEEFFSGYGVRGDAAPRTIFAVGDEKQSIFSFQGADPTEFGRQRAFFKAQVEGAHLAFADLRPAVSRRSARAILEFVDAVFAQAKARDGISSTDDAIHHDAHRSETGRVEIWPAVEATQTEESDPWDQPVDAPSRSSAQTVLAARIATRIAEWLDKRATIPGTDTRITPGDIMILVRRRNAFAEEMIRQLLDKRVPVAGADRMVLMEQIAIADLVALGRFALLPDDDLNLAALLKSPLVGFSENDLYDLAQPRDGKTLWDELRGRKDERSVFERAHRFLADMLGQADFLPPFEFYARALGKGLRRRLTARLGSEAADAIDEFLALALAHEGTHPPSLESFLNWFEKGASDVKRDMEKGDRAVRVMTVHGAKGLEANIVILPDTAQVPDHERRDPLLYSEDCVFFGVKNALDTPKITAAKAAARLREMREYRRLLYVAATRAREFLIVCGYEMKTGIHPDSWYGHLREAAARIGREERIAGETVIAFGANFSGGSAELLALHQPPTRVPKFLAQIPEPEPPLRVLRPSEAAGLEEYPPTSPLEDSAKRFRRGLLVHALLAHLPAFPPEKREATARSYLTRQGLTPSEGESLIEETLAVMDDIVFAELFSQNSRAEIAVTAQLPELGNVRINGQIDRLAVTRDRVLIADFKTNRPPPDSAENTPRLYRTQMALYRAALQKIYPGKRVDCALVWTDGAKLMPLSEALLDAEIARIAAAGSTDGAA